MHPSDHTNDVDPYARGSQDRISPSWRDLCAGMDEWSAMSREQDLRENNT
jgi:hypothetical protein